MIYSSKISLIHLRQNGPKSNTSDSDADSWFLILDSWFFWFSWFRRIFSLILDADSWFLILGFFDSVDSGAFSDSWFLIPDSWILWFSWFRGIFRFLILRLILDSWFLNSLIQRIQVLFVNSWGWFLNALIQRIQVLFSDSGGWFLMLDFL